MSKILFLVKFVASTVNNDEQRDKLMSIWQNPFLFTSKGFKFTSSFFCVWKLLYYGTTAMRPILIMVTLPRIWYLDNTHTYNYADDTCFFNALAMRLMMTWTLVEMHSSNYYFSEHFCCSKLSCSYWLAYKNSEYITLKKIHFRV